MDDPSGVTLRCASECSLAEAQVQRMRIRSHGKAPRCTVSSPPTSCCHHRAMEKHSDQGPSPNHAKRHAVSAGSDEPKGLRRAGATGRRASRREAAARIFVVIESRKRLALSSSAPHGQLHFALGGAAASLPWHAGGSKGSEDGRNDDDMRARRGERAGSAPTRRRTKVFLRCTLG